MAEKSVAVRLSAKVNQYVAAMKAAEASTTGFSRSTQRNLKAVGSQMQGIGRSMTLFVSTPLALAGAGAVKAAIDWESAWAGVTKTVDGTATQMAGLEDGLRSMAKELPATHGEIAAVAEAAGALGVATGDIETFTRVMIDLGETTNLTADEAATSIAKLMNVMRSAPDDVDNLGSALVHLGNNGASTEAEILDMATRIASAGAIIGLSEDDVLGFANALSSMGIEAEAGGTAFSRVITDISKAVSQGGDDLSAFASVAGVSASQFATAFREDPAQAVVSFIEGLGRIQAAGGDVFTVLDELGLSDVRVSRALLSMAGNTGLLTDSLAMSEQAWGDNTALADEAAKRYATTGAQFEMVRNKVVDLGINLGRILLPAVEFVVDGIGKLAEAFQSLPGPVQAVLLGIGGLAATAGPLVFVAGSLVKNFVQLRAATSLLGGALGTAGKAFGILGLAAVAGVAAYQILTAEQRQTEQNTRTSTDALNMQFPALLNAAVAAARTAEQIDAVALANEAMSLAIAEGNTQLAESAAKLNVSGDQILDVLSLMDADSEMLTSTIDFLSRSFGLNAEQADFVARNYANLAIGGVGPLNQGLIDQAEALGLSESAFDDVTTSIRSFLDAADESEVQDIAAAFLDARVSAFGLDESLVGLATTNAELANRMEDPLAVYQEWVKLIAEADPATRAAAGVTDEVAAAVAAAGDAAGGAAPQFEDFTEEAFDASDAIDTLAGMLEVDFANAIRRLGGLEPFQIVNPLAIREVEAYRDAFNALIGPQRDFARAQVDAWGAVQELGDALDDSSTSLDVQTKAGRTNTLAIFDAMDTMLGLADAQLAAGDSIEDVNTTLDGNIGWLLDAAEAAGLNRDKVEDLIDSYVDIPETVETAIELAGEDIAMKKLEDMLLEMEDLDEGVTAEVLTIAETEGAWAAVRALQNRINGTSATMRVRMSVPIVRATVSGDGRQVSVGKIGTAIVARHGAYTGMGGAEGIPAVLHRDEAVLPLSSPTDMARILGMSEVGPRVAAALAGAWPSGDGWGGASYSTVQHVTVNMPPGANGDDVVRALRKWERRRGPVPISVR